MTPDDIPEFRDVLTDALSYWGQSLSSFALDVWWQAMTGYELVDVKRALGLHAMDPDRGAFVPRPADVVRQLEGSTQTVAMRAWAKVERSLGAIGAYQTVAFDDPLIHAVIEEMGGWPPLCHTAVSELPFRAREFEKRYAGYRLRREVPPYPRALIGISEAENRMRGLPVPRPVLIGDPARASRVLAGGNDGGSLRITQAGDAVIDAVRLIQQENRRSA